MALLGTLVLTSTGGLVRPADAAVPGTHPITFTANSATITVGDPVPSIGATVSGDDGHPYATPTCNVVGTVDTAQAYTTRCTGTANDGYYAYTYVDGTLDVQRAAVTVQASSETVTLGSAISPVTPTMTGDVSGLPVDGSISCTHDTVTGVGVFATSCTGPAQDGYYDYTYADGSLTVTRGAVTITADSATIAYGDPNPTIGSSESGSDPGVAITTPTCSIVDENTVPGSYVTTCTGPAGDDNYDYSYVDGSLVIGDAAVTITADSPTVALGQPLPGPGIVDTFAGDTTGAAGYGGDGGQAVGAQLDGPASTAVDHSGNVYIADAANHVVRKVATDGTISTFAGPGTCGCSNGDGGQATDAYIDEPSGVAVDGFGNVYIAEYYENVVRKVAPDGVITTVAGTGNPGYSGDGNLATRAEIDGPTGIAVDAGGTLYIADYNNAVVRQVSSTGTITTLAGNGSTGGGGDGGPALDASLDGPVAVAVSTSGAVYVADAGNNRVRVVAGGNIDNFAGTGNPWTAGDGGPAVDADVDDPEAVAVDPWGNVFIAEYGGNVVRRVAADGTISTFAGCGCTGYSGDGGPAIEATFDGLVGVSVDPIGRVYLADLYNNVVRRVTYDGVGFTVSGDIPEVPIATPTCAVVGGVTGPGTYPTSCTGTDESPYTYTFVDGVLTVTKATVHVYASSAVFTTSATPPAVAFATVGDVAGYPLGGFSCEVAPISGAGTYATSCTGPESDANYDYVYVDGAYRVTNPSVIITADSPSIGELDPTPTIGYTVSGDLGADPVDASIVCDVEPLAGPGLYTTSCTGPASDAHYDYTYVDGELTVRANVSITADDLSTTFGTPIDQSLVSRVAGTGVCARSGDGFAATAAELCAPIATAIDGAGNVFVAELVSHTVRRIATDGTITTVAGTGTCGYTDGVAATLAELCGPGGVAVNAAGDLYISDSGNRVVRVVDHVSGLISTVAGTGSCGTIVDGSAALAADLCNPAGLAVGTGGDVIVVDAGSNVVVAVDPGGVLHVVAGTGACGAGGDGGPALLAELCTPLAAAVDASGTVYIADLGNNAVRRVTGGNLDTVVNQSFTCASSGDGGPATAAEVCGVYAVAVDGDGNLYVSEAANGDIRRVDTNGDISTFAGPGCGCGNGDGRPAVEASFVAPIGLAADAGGHLYIADLAANTVRLVTTTSSPVPGGPVPAPYTTSGEYGPPIAQPTCASDAPTGPGTFTITCTGPASDRFYDYSYAPGTLTVDQAPLTVTASSATIFFGDSYTVTSTVSGELPEYPVGPLDCFVVDPITGPGTYPTRCERGGRAPAGVELVSTSFESVDPYDITFVDGTLTVRAESIAGTVTRQETGDPLGGIQVTVYNSSGVVAATTTTAKDGTYHVVGLNPGKYKVRFVDPTNAVPTEYWDNKFTFGTATQVTVVANVASTGIDAAMGLASLAGTVTDGFDSSPMAGYQVALINSSGVTVQTSTTAADGTYRFIGVAAGTYKVRYTDPAGIRAPEHYHGQAAFGTATPVAVGSGASVTGIDEAIRFTTITGTVHGSAGDALAGISVSILNGTGGVIRTVTTDANGRYVAGYLIPGSYRVRFVDGAGGRPTVYWPNAPSIATATPVTITTATVDNIDAVMVGAISGRVTDFTSGAGIAGVQVTAFNTSGVAVLTVATDPSGAYTIAGLSNGTYRVRFVDPAGRPTRYWAGSSTYVGATAVTVNPAATGVDIALGYSSIQGVVTAQGSGTPLAGIVVNVYNSSGVLVGTTTTGAGGTYTIGGLKAGNHKVRFSDPSNAHPTRFWNGATTFAAATPIAVGDVQIVTGINIALP